jgi:type III restriction enzyme
VNRIREAGHAWRLKGYPPATHETQRLLDHCAAGHTNPPLFFCQLEAVETMIWLAEAAPQSVEGRAKLEELAGYNPGLSRISAKMATGSGKTTVLALLIAWQAVNAARKRRRFSDAFLLICPGITIRDRLSVVRVFGTSELIEHWRALAHLVQVMPLGRDGSSGGFGW